MIEHILNTDSREEIMILLLNISPFECIPDIEPILNPTTHNKEPKIKPVRTKNNYHKRYRVHLNSCRSREIDNHLTEEQYLFIISQPCTYCPNPASGVDRIDSNLPYTMGNSQPACRICNMMKHIHSEEKFLSHIGSIATHLGLINDRL